MDDLVSRDLAVFFHPCAQMRDLQALPPLPIERAEGVWLHTTDGRRILDGIASWWCKALGHGHPRLRRALVEQAEAFEHVIAANTTHHGLVRCCERLLAMANGLPVSEWGPGAAPGKRPGHLSRVFLADNGSTAVEIALKLAMQAQAHRGHPQRSGFACLEGAYHGETVGTLSVSDCDIYATHYRPLMFPSLKVGGLPLRSGPDDPRWLDASAEWPAIEQALEAQAGQLAAIIYEPVLQGAGGMRLISPDLLPRLRRWADAHGVFLIADEIAAGFGRCGSMCAAHLAPGGAAAAMPDLCCLSKGLTGGALPLSAVLMTEELYSAFDAEYHEGRNFLHSNTWTGHPLALAVANAVMDVFADDAMCDHVNALGPQLRAGLQRIADAHPGRFSAVRGVGMMAAMDLQGVDPTARTGRKIFAAALERGALLRPLGDTLYVFPPLVISEGEVGELVGVLEAAVGSVL